MIGSRLAFLLTPTRSGVLAGLVVNGAAVEGRCGAKCRRAAISSKKQRNNLEKERTKNVEKYYILAQAFPFHLHPGKKTGKIPSVFLKIHYEYKFVVYTYIFFLHSS